MSKVRRAPRPKKPAPRGELKKPRPVWFVTLMAFVLPGSGQWLNGAPVRGMIMQFSMILGSYLTYQITTPEISPVGRLAGGLLVWVFSIVDAHGIATRRVKAWARIEAGLPGPSRQAAKALSASAAEPVEQPKAKKAAGTGSGKSSPGSRRKRVTGPSGRPATSGSRDT